LIIATHGGGFIFSLLGQGMTAVPGIEPERFPVKEIQMIVPFLELFRPHGLQKPYPTLCNLLLLSAVASLSTKINKKKGVGIAISRSSPL
jgi:hypothetical protein